MNITIIANAHKYGGGERSVIEIMRMLLREGHAVRFIPTQFVCPEFIPPAGVFTDRSLLSAGAQHADLLLLYGNNTLLSRDELVPRRIAMHASRSDRRVLVINYRIGWAATPAFARLWHAVGFLNTTTQKAWLNQIRCPTFVLPSPVDTSPFLGIKPDYTKIVAVRHSHPSKYSKDAVAMLATALQSCPGLSFDLMGVPPAVEAFSRTEPRVKIRGFDTSPVAEYLASGSVFWHALHGQVQDQGPRTVIEAMAAGLPCIVDDCDGAADRVTDDTGWKCSDASAFIRAFQEIQHDPSVLERKGQAAKARALAEFKPENWVDRILRCR
jgi:glycosyltransferase involved in cell wall biosynthesis